MRYITSRFKNSFRRHVFCATCFLLCCIGIAQRDNTLKTKPPISGSWSSHHIVLSFGVGNYYIDPFIFYKVPETVQSSTLSSVESSVMHFKAELAMNNHLGLAVCVNRSELDFNSTYYTNTNSYYSTARQLATVHVILKTTVVNLRLNYHFLCEKPFDPYIGLGMGLRNIEMTGSGEKIGVFEPTIPFGFELTAGLRYLFFSRLGAYIEAGVGRSIYQAGISLNVGRLKPKFRRHLR